MPEKPVEKRKGSFYRAFDFARRIINQLITKELDDNMKGLEEQIYKYNKGWHGDTGEPIGADLTRRIAKLAKDNGAAHAAYTKVKYQYIQVKQEAQRISNDMDRMNRGQKPRDRTLRRR